MKFIIIAAAALLFSGEAGAGAAEIKVLSTQATEEAYRELVPLFEQASGHKVTTIFTGTLDVQKRIAAGETYDLIIMAGPAIDDFIKSGKIVPGSRVDLARSGVGVAVRAGAPKPDISSTEALKKTLIAAKSIGYSTGPSARRHPGDHGVRKRRPGRGKAGRSREGLGEIPHSACRCAGIHEARVGARVRPVARMKRPNLIRASSECGAVVSSGAAPAKTAQPFPDEATAHA